MARWPARPKGNPVSPTRLGVSVDQWRAGLRARHARKPLFHCELRLVLRARLRIRIERAHRLAQMILQLLQANGVKRTRVLPDSFFITFALARSALDCQSGITHTSV